MPKSVSSFVDVIVVKRVVGENDPIIPYFFIAPDQNVAEVLNQLAISTQTAMFFDEYNNFVMMTKNYILPSPGDRKASVTLYGTNDQENTGVIRNRHTNTKLANIIEYTDQDSKVYNDGNITYNSRHIQRSIGSLKQASLIDNEKTWIYKPVLLMLYFLHLLSKKQPLESKDNILLVYCKYLHSYLQNN